MINVTFNLKTFKKRIKYLYLINTIIYIIIFFTFFNINLQNTPENKNINLIKKKEEKDIIPPKPKEKWKYIKKLKDL